MDKLPSKDALLAWIRENPGETSKRELARAFGIKGADRIPLKRMLKELEESGEIRKDGKHIREPGALPPVSVLRVTGPDSAGDLWAEPAQWDSDDPLPRILVHLRAAEPALGEGDRILARLSPSDAEGVAYDARLIRRIGHGPRKVLGLYRQTEAGGRILSLERGAGHEWTVGAGERMGAQDGELVEAEQTGPRDRLGLHRARVTARLGDPSAPKSVSLIAIHAHGIPDEFPPEALAQAEAARPIDSAQGRDDLRHLPLITIDPSDARDHDDAVCALPDPAVDGGHIVWVAIADVAAYVRPGTALDDAGRERGNSTYFPDRVVPMLPEALSADLCSLHEGVDRPCIAVEMKLDAAGRKTAHRFVRGLMRSPAALAYEQVQAAIDGRPDDATADLLEPVLEPLWAAWRAANAARDKRQPLNLDLPERRIVLAEDGSVRSVAFRDRLDAHRLIEEFMILANVCAAETLERKHTPLLYRVHEEPDPEKIEALRETASAAGLSLAKGQVLTTKSLNRLLDQAAGRDEAELINLSVLRSMTQAYYAPQNFGHFGLSLRAYAHFTSPIRRYADLIVHRALIAAHGWGGGAGKHRDKLSELDIERLDATAEWISATERRSMQAERDTTDRYLAAYLADRVGSEFAGRVSGVARFGLFVKLDDTGADGLVPIGTLGDEYFHHDRDAQTLMGDRSGRIIGLGQRALVRLTEAQAVTGGLVFELLELEGESLPRASRPVGRPTRRAPGRAKAKRIAAKKKLKRRTRP
ncbi:ribonuclease R [Rhodobacteraceae bacterium 2CG4]|uniref:Ribonuclease R n=1 Tax=Halovulum marinum TaxID=2662447 RepID=A0A6L5YVZ9_9RHOB|nr:ribonuclease R [Halovulum marinum]MSU88523.1 ribonuclease R [Halovulum marinum]